MSLFTRHGAAVFDGLLPAHLCEALASELAVSGSSQREVVNGRLRSDVVGDPNDASLRWHRAQSPGHGLVGEIARLLAEHLGGFLVAALGTPAEKVHLLECASIVTYPGAPAQTWYAAPHKTLYCLPQLHVDLSTSRGRHADSDLHNVCEATAAVLQVQLVDMDSALGPIELRPFVPLDTELVDLQMHLKAGSVVAYDSKVWHRGGANVGSQPRPVLYTTWMAADDGLLPRNLGFTLPDSDIGAWTLARLQGAPTEAVEPDSSTTARRTSKARRARSTGGHHSVPIEVAF